MPTSKLELQSRRTFCAHACQAASLLAVGSLASACGGSPTSPSGSSADPLRSAAATVSGRVVTVAVDATSPLATGGSAAIVTTSLGSQLVTRTGDSSFAAFTAVCTHEGCTITGFANSQFVCPCHGSKFTTSGSVASGPATRSLQQYQTQFANGVLTFTV
jgi:cytochrome b6-f complex iron-sulfur subunit